MAEQRAVLEQRVACVLEEVRVTRSKAEPSATRRSKQMAAQMAHRAAAEERLAEARAEREREHGAFVAARDELQERVRTAQDSCMLFDMSASVAEIQRLEAALASAVARTGEANTRRVRAEEACVAASNTCDEEAVGSWA